MLSDMLLLAFTRGSSSALMDVHQLPCVHTHTSPESHFGCFFLKWKWNQSIFSDIRVIQWARSHSKAGESWQQEAKAEAKALAHKCLQTLVPYSRCSHLFLWRGQNRRRRCGACSNCQLKVKSKISDVFKESMVSQTLLDSPAKVFTRDTKRWR